MVDSVQAGLPLISLMLLALPAGALMIWVVPSPRHARWIALVTALIDLGLSLVILARFDSAQAGFQWVERALWMPTLNVHYLVGVDGISVLFLPLTGLLFVAALLAPWNVSRTMPRLYYTLFLLLEGATLGVFCALDLVLFFVFWEMTLIPLYFLISLWGLGPNRRYAAVKYTLFMLAGGMPLLFGFLLLALSYAEVGGLAVPDGLVWSYMELLKTPVPDQVETLVFLLLLLGFAFKTPVFPLHTWLPVVSMEGPASVTALLTGLKLGAYGLLRFTVPLAPSAAREFHWLLAGLGVIGILYGALAALAQTNLRRMLAYSSVSHVGLVVLGIASLNLQGIQGALFQLLNFTVVAGGIFLLTGLLRHRIGSTDVANLGGAAKSMPLLTAFFFLFGLAALGVPGTSGFPAELLILLSALKTHTGAGLAALVGVVLGAGYFLGMFRRAFLGPIRQPVVADAQDLRPRELAVAALLALIVLFNGLYPQGVLDVSRLASQTWAQRVHAPGG